MQSFYFKKVFAIGLSELNIENCNAYEYVSEMRILQDMLTLLSITTEDIFQFFSWNGLSLPLQHNLINICNNNKPSFKDINDNIFKAITLR